MSHRFRTFVLPALLAAVTLAGPAVANRGWFYDADQLWPGAIYDFGDGNRLVGRCHSKPVFILKGRYPATKVFTLTIDGKPQTLTAWNGEHGPALIVDDPKASARFVGARHTLNFRVGRWSRTAPSSPLIDRLRIACKGLHHAHVHDG